LTNIAVIVLSLTWVRYVDVTTLAKSKRGVKASDVDAGGAVAAGPTQEVF
jgi:hypothetical protein